MKKIWKIKRDSEAVSPVIATILMVAITVVLAAVLLVLVLNIGDDTTPPAAAITWSDTEEMVVIQSMFPSTSKADIGWTLNGTTVPDLNITYSDEVNTNVVSGMMVEINGTATVGIATGDIIRMIYKPTGGVIAQTTVGVVS